MNNVISHSGCFIASLLGLLMLSACSSSEGITSSVYEGLYQFDHEFEHDVFIRQATTDSASVYFKLNTSELLHKRPGPDKDFQVLVDFEVLTSTPTERIGDTLFYRYSQLHEIGEAEEVFGVFKIPLKDTLAYEVNVRIVDRHSGRSVVRTNFLGVGMDDPRYVTSYTNGQAREYCTCQEGEEVVFDIYGWSNGQIQLSIYDVEIELAPPPFSISPSSVPKLSLLGSNQLTHDSRIVLSCPGKGMLQFQDMQTERLVSVPVFRKGFPYMTDRDEMMAVLKYMTTSGEYKDMRLSENPRMAFEYFWLDCGGSRERARVLIENFYSRVEEANVNFSTLVEGWKTDRGLIHIIYGPPSHILRLSDREVWFYGSDRSENTLKMIFYKKEDYILDRSLDYRQSWYLTVDSWRSGRTIGQ